jgi:enamine deaminase RidA (YjgF/YER057c/UK114 family)
MAGDVLARLTAAKLTLPPDFAPIANYVPTVRAGNLLYISGMGPIEGKKMVWVGALGRALDIAAGRKAAELTALNLLARIEGEIGLDRVRRVIRLFGLVNVDPEFYEVDDVLDAASQVMITAYGEAGKHVRTSIGVPSLPNSIAVEIDAVVEIAE